jgi:hypothetical protein
MEATTLVHSVPPATEVDRSGGGMGYDEAMPSAPPDLVEKFEAMMARTTAAPTNEPKIPESVVSGVQGHLDQYTQIFDQMASMDPKSMNMGEMTLVGMRMTMQMGMLSMQHSAYSQALTSSKGAVGSLMKNQ